MFSLFRAAPLRGEQYHATALWLIDFPMPFHWSLPSTTVTHRWRPTCCLHAQETPNTAPQDPMQGLGAWSSRTQHVTHLRPMSHWSSLPPPQAIPGGPLCFFFHMWTVPITITEDCHAIHVHNQLKTPSRATPCRALVHEVHTYDAWPVSSEFPLVSIGLITFITSSIHMT